MAIRSCGFILYSLFPIVNKEDYNPQLEYLHVCKSQTCMNVSHIIVLMDTSHLCTSVHHIHMPPMKANWFREVSKKRTLETFQVLKFFLFLNLKKNKK